jgi:hypothetical protein
MACGQSRHNQSTTAGRSIVCHEKDRDRCGRIVANLSSVRRGSRRHDGARGTGLGVRSIQQRPCWPGGQGERSPARRASCGTSGSGWYPVADYPTAEWTGRQLTDAFPWDAERACGETDRLNPPGMPGSFRHLWRRFTCGESLTPTPAIAMKCERTCPWTRMRRAVVRPSASAVRCQASPRRTSA